MKTLFLNKHKIHCTITLLRKDYFLTFFSLNMILLFFYALKVMQANNSNFSTEPTLPDV